MRLLDKILNVMKPDKEEFAQIVIDTLHLNGVEGEIQYQAGQYALKLPSGDTIFLSNHYLAYCKATPPEQEKILVGITASIKPPVLPASFDEAKDCLRPFLTTLAEMELNTLALRAAGYEAPQYAFIPFAGELVLGLALDTPQNIVQVTQEQLDRWNVQLDPTLDTAKRVLREQSLPVFIEMGHGVYQSDWNDGYDASRLLFTDLCREAAPAQGKLVAIVPNRNYLLLTNFDNEAGLKQMAELAISILDEEPHPVSAEVLILEGNTWQPLPLDAGKTSHNKIIQLKKQHLLTLYNRQKALLDKVYEDDEEIFVATLNGHKDEDGQLSTYATWTEDVNTLLPETDIIVMVPDEGEPFGVVWNKIRSALPDEFKPRGFHPERYLVEDFPSTDLLNSLRIT